MPDHLRVSVIGRLARLAGRGPPEGSGKRWRSGHATNMLPGKSGESPRSDGHGAAWFISPWRSDGAFHGETPPRLKVVTRADQSADESRSDRIPARHTSKMAGATRTAMRSRRADPSQNSPARLRPGRSRDHAPPEKTRGIAEARYPRIHRRSIQTMTQTVAHRKRIVNRRHEPAQINVQGVNPYPIW